MTRWQFFIDVGGTFTDCIAKTPESVESESAIIRYKTLSSGVIKGCADKGSDETRIADARRRNDPPGIWNGLRLRSEWGTFSVERFEHGVLHLEQMSVGFASEDDRARSHGNYEILTDDPAPLVAIRFLLGIPWNESLPPMDIRLGTTRGTNALLTRSGSRTALVTTSGFRDVLRIGYQARPDLFALSIEKPDELYASVVEIDERLDANGTVLKSLDEQAALNSLRDLKSKGIESLAVALLHACANPRHERQLARLAEQLEFQNVSLSHEVSSIRKLVPRGDTTVIDAYLNPVLRSYIDRIKSSLHPDSTLELMTSSGGLASATQFRGKDSILSGPAGGVVGVAKVAVQAGFASAIGFDMGGTSTDVSRWSRHADDGGLQLEYETEKAGVRVTTPMVAIETVAAGGGSICHFDGVKLAVGPASAGADPGPACYGRGGPLAVTDLNFFLGKIPPAAFPFDLDRDAVEDLLDDQCREIFAKTGKQYTTIELADGYSRIANTNMAEAIRCISVERGIDPRSDVLVAFGGAAAQHACAVATELGMSKILLHPSAGILSALGIGLAEVTVHRERGVYEKFDAIRPGLEDLFGSLSSAAKQELANSAGQGSAEHSLSHRESRALRPGEGESQTSVESTRDSPSPLDNSRPSRWAGEVKKTRTPLLACSLDLRFLGLDEPITIARPENDDFQAAYEAEFESRCGYLPPNRELEVVTARVTAVAARKDTSQPSKQVSETREAKQKISQLAYFDAKPTFTKHFDRDVLQPGHLVVGPAIVTESISTIVVDPGWQAEVLSGDELLLTCDPSSNAQHTIDVSSEADPSLLEVFNKRFATIATQMGSALRKNSRSVNVKERLDYSCAIFTAEGDLVVNAPHIPVHLGAMGATVQHVLDTIPLSPGDVVVTNDPYHGGSHLPDVTVITPVHSDEGELLFFTASRAHHAEIGGISPGSMPAFSKSLAEEGVLIRAMKCVEQGESRIDSLRRLLASSPFPSRDPDLNIADVIAQIAANRQGANGLLSFVESQSWPVVAQYMKFIQAAAEQKTRAALSRLPDGQREFVDHLDDGTPIAVVVTITGDSAKIDFTGTGAVLEGNLNANRAITTAATLYCLRLLVNEDIPLNAGVLKPIEIELPTCLLNPPSNDDPKRCPAIVGGNVETSQRIVDVILGAFGIAAASQGTMNNFLFGNESFGYYETICGGSGATSLVCGANAVHTHMTNTRLTDPEVLEARFPVRLNRFEIRIDSGGKGKHHGGSGVIREIEFLEPLDVSLLTQRRGAYAPFGLDGGGDGQVGVNEIRYVDGREEKLDGIASLAVKVGDRIRISTPGGGGWGAE